MQPGSNNHWSGSNTALLNSLLTQHRNRAYAIALKYLQSPADAEDIVQNAFIKVFLNIDQFRNEAAFSTWLYKIVYHECLKYLSKKKYFFEPPELPEENDTGADNSVQYEWNMEQLKRSFELLSALEYMLIQLFYYEDKSIKEISVVTNLTAANIKVKLHRARNKMAASFKQFKEK